MYKPAQEKPEEKQLPSARESIQSNIGAELMDMDKLFTNVYNAMPQVNSELIYSVELNTISKVHLLSLAIGLMMFIAVVLTTF